MPDKIYETAEGGLTDGEPMFFACRPTGTQYRRQPTTSALARNWSAGIIAASMRAPAKFTNKALLTQWIADYVD